MLRDILRGDDRQVDAASALLLNRRPHILVLQGFDHDLENSALHAFAAHLASLGLSYPYQFAARPNTGLRSAFDLDGDGRLGEARDAQGYGQFSGQGGMAILSQYPLLTDSAQDFTALLWRDLPGAALPTHPDGTPFPSAKAQAAQRLSSTAHWALPVETPDGPLWLLSFHATPPVFDGPEDRNGKRNHDEILFWKHYLNGAFGPAPQSRFVLLGDANNDPDRGEGHKTAINALLTDPRLQDPLPGEITARWENPGPMRVDYLLPSADLTLLDAGIDWDEKASRHGLVWAEVE